MMIIIFLILLLLLKRNARGGWDAIEIQSEFNLIAF